MILLMEKNCKNGYMGKISADKRICHAPKMRQKGSVIDNQPVSDGFVLGKRIADCPRNFSSSRYQAG